MKRLDYSRAAKQKKIDEENARKQAIIDEENARQQAIIDAENARKQAIIDEENARIAAEEEKQKKSLMNMFRVSPSKNKPASASGSRSGSPEKSKPAPSPEKPKAVASPDKPERPKQPEVKPQVQNTKVVVKSNPIAATKQPVKTAPIVKTAPPAPTQVPEETVPEDIWVEVKDENTGRMYWWNQETNETTALDAPKPTGHTARATHGNQAAAGGCCIIN